MSDMFYNYIVGFADLLGQKEALKGQQLLPDFRQPGSEAQFMETVKVTVGRVNSVHTIADAFIQQVMQAHEMPTILASTRKEILADLGRTRLSQQRWSDGFVYFSPIGDDAIPVPMNAVYAIIGGLGLLCFLGLAFKQPLRGGIDIGWGVEMRPSELYGAGLARAYDLESKIAQSPRIVVGPHVLEYLKQTQQHPRTTLIDQTNGALADVCASMLIRDQDGHWIINYLGEAFKSVINTQHHRKNYTDALQFIRESLTKYAAGGDQKLLTRYELLEQYFAAHPQT